MFRRQRERSRHIPCSGSRSHASFAGLGTWIRVGEEEANINEGKWTVSCIRGCMLLQAFPAFSSTLPVPSINDIAARVLHFGTDDCNRLLVLRSVGYSVDLCPTVEEFHSLMQKRTGADAILVTGVPVGERRQVVTLTRERSHAPLVLFNTSYDYADEGKFDLVIPPLTRPEEWLRKIAATIEIKRLFASWQPLARQSGAAPNA